MTNTRSVASDTRSIVPFVDLRQQNEEVNAEILQAIHGVVNEGAFVLGPQVSRFEDEYASLRNGALCWRRKRH